MTGQISVILTTYQREDALDAVLRGLARQTDREFEILVADDGSGPRTRALIGRWAADIGVRLGHFSARTQLRFKSHYLGDLSDAWPTLGMARRE